jgi:hypothetical protein
MRLVDGAPAGPRLGAVCVESLLFMPPMLLGTSLGLTLFRRLSDVTSG